MEKQRHRQASKLALEALAERAESVGDVERAKYLRRIVARLHDLGAAPEAAGDAGAGNPAQEP